ncbi:MAG: RluA family pseudouridine synthase [Eubacteriales bacterium]
MNQVVLHEDTHLLVVHKPAGIATQTNRIGEVDLVSQMKNYVKGNYIGVINRLDQQVEGIVLFAKTQEAARLLSRQMQENQMQKQYKALVVGIPKTRETLVHYLRKEQKGNRSCVVEQGTQDSKKASLSYQTIQQYEGLLTKERISLLSVYLETGRHHQIRVQFAHEEIPIIGDFKYGNDVSKEISCQLKIEGIALCAVGLMCIHPIQKKKIEWNVEPNWMKLTEKLHCI